MKIIFNALEQFELVSIFSFFNVILTNAAVVLRLTYIVSFFFSLHKMFIRFQAVLESSFKVALPFVYKNTIKFLSTKWFISIMILFLQNPAFCDSVSQGNVGKYQGTIVLICWVALVSIGILDYIVIPQKVKDLIKNTCLNSDKQRYAWLVHGKEFIRTLNFRSGPSMQIRNGEIKNLSAQAFETLRLSGRWNMIAKAAISKNNSLIAKIVAGFELSEKERAELINSSAFRRDYANFYDSQGIFDPNNVTDGLQVLNENLAMAPLVFDHYGTISFAVQNVPVG
jgi:hypothetical protein